jgi:AhpC/TSA family
VGIIDGIHDLTGVVVMGLDSYPGDIWSTEAARPRHTPLMTRFASIALMALVSHLSAVTPSLAASQAVRPPLAGEAAPDFTLADQNGKPVRLSAARGQKVVLVFYRGYW